MMVLGCVAVGSLAWLLERRVPESANEVATAEAVAI